MSIESNMNDVAAAFVEHIDKGAIADLIWKANPRLVLTPTDESMADAYFTHFMEFGSSQGTTLGGTLATAVKNVTPAQTAVMHIPLVPLYGVSDMNRQAVLSADRKGADSFVDFVELHMRTSIYNCANILSKAISSDGTNSLGLIKSVQVSPAGYPTGSAKITLASSTSYRNFEYQATLDLTVASGSAPLAFGGTTVTVTVLAVDAGSGKLILSVPNTGTWSNTPNNTSTVGTGDWLIRDGDYAPNKFSTSIVTGSQPPGTPFQAPTNNVPFAGFGAWIPPASFRANPGLMQPFFQQIRDYNATRLAGIGMDLSSVGNVISEMIQAAITMSQYATDENMGPDYCFCGPNTYNAAMQILQSQKLYYDKATVEPMANVSYDFVQIYGGPLPLKLVMDPNMPPFTFDLTAISTTSLNSMGKLPAPQTFNGLPLVPLQSNGVDSFRAVTGGFGQFVVKNPSLNGRFTCSA